MRADPFTDRDPGEVVAEINRIRLGTLVTPDFQATALPWVAQRDDTGALVLWSHLARRNPQVAALASAPQALVAFTGANGYVSPRWLPTPHSAPTWNYITVHVVGACRLLGPAQTEVVVEKLVAAQESGRAAPWTSAEMGPRRGQLLPYVVGVRLDVIRTAAKFKLGQKDSAADLAATLEALEREGQHALAERMRLECLAKPVTAAEARPPAGTAR